MNFMGRSGMMSSRNSRNRRNSGRNRSRKGFGSMTGFLTVSAVIIVVLIVIVNVAPIAPKPKPVEVKAEVTQPVTEPVSYQIQGVPIVSQNELKAGCETYACTMLLKSLGFDTDEFDFSENYLICSPISYGEDGTRFGPDMYSAFAGTVENGYGIYSPAMAKSMNKFFEAKKSKLKATSVVGETLESLCQKYVKNGTAVMVWATTYMQEPYEKASWVVDFVDENAKTKKGDTFTWLQNEHCMVLRGYDQKDYLMADSVAGKVSHFEKKLAEQRFRELGSQAIVAMEQ